MGGSQRGAGVRAGRPESRSHLHVLNASRLYWRVVLKLSTGLMCFQTFGHSKSSGDITRDVETMTNQ